VWSSAPKLSDMASSTGPSARLKITSIACGILILVLRALYAANMLRLRPLGPWYLASATVAIGVPIAIWVVVARPELRRRPTFGLDTTHGRYVVGHHPGRTLTGLLMFCWGSLVPPVERVPNTDHMRLSTVPGMVPVGAVLLGVAIAFGLTLILLERPVLHLDADGMTFVRFLARRRRVAWSDIAARSVMAQGRGFRVDRIVWDASAPSRSTLTALPGNVLQVDPVFLLHAVRVYVDQPERRSEIGTQAGLDRLQRERSDALAAAAGSIG
jgi:hypothetical protein